MAKTTVAVIGGSGTLGRYLTDGLLDNGHYDVTVITRKVSGASRPCCCWWWLCGGGGVQAKDEGQVRRRCRPRAWPSSMAAAFLSCPSGACPRRCVGCWQACQAHQPSQNRAPLKQVRLPTAPTPRQGGDDGKLAPFVAKGAKVAHVDFDDEASLVHALKGETTETTMLWGRRRGARRAITCMHTHARTARTHNRHPHTHNTRVISNLEPCSTTAPMSPAVAYRRRGQGYSLTPGGGVFVCLCVGVGVGGGGEGGGHAASQTRPMCLNRVYVPATYGP